MPPGPKPGALPDELHLEGEKTYEIVVLTELVKIVVKPLLRGEVKRQMLVFPPFFSRFLAFLKRGSGSDL